MRERDFELAKEIHAQIKSVEGDYGSHDNFGKHLKLVFEFPYEQGHSSQKDWADVAKALDINHDELHMRTNLLIRAMLDEKMVKIKTEFKKLGIKMEDDEPAPKAKTPKQKLIAGPKTKE